ncbi:MAG: four helix bundle protein [Paludibacter sp.]|mgnify:CR=1 FL=1|jgi:four helix bundle protein|nr:four helix bundle protein [Paludibacter sp.]
MIQRYEDLIVWQLSRMLVIDVYKLFEKNRDFDFKSQIQRASISIMNNIAEGFEKGQISKDNKQFINFLNISYGSCGEVKSMLYVAEDLKYVDEIIAKQLRDKCYSLSQKILAFIKYLQKNDKPKQQ